MEGKVGGLPILYPRWSELLEQGYDAIGEC
jgi:hypothetical protein